MTELPTEALQAAAEQTRSQAQDRVGAMGELASEALDTVGELVSDVADGALDGVGEALSSAGSALVDGAGEALGGLLGAIFD